MTYVDLPLYLTEALLVLSALATVTLAVLSALFERSGHIRLHHWAEQAGGALHATYVVPRYFESFRFLISLFARLMPVFYLWSLWTLLATLEVGVDWWLAPAVVVSTLFFVEWLNRFLVKVYSEEALRFLTPVYRVVHFVLRPILFVLAPLVRFVEENDELEGEEDSAAITEDEIDAFIDVGKREGILEEQHEDLVRSVVDFVDSEVYSVMTPRVEINAMPAEATLEELAQKFFETKNSRLPLFRDSIDQIVGILHIRDVFGAFLRQTQGLRAPPAIELCQQPHYVPESKKLRELLEEMRALHQQMAIVVDDYGGVAGLVTIEDLVEEIVGDIRDEHEAKPDVRELLEDGRWRLTGRTYLADLAELLDLDLDVDSMQYETISGLVCGELGYVPQVGEQLETHGLILTVEGADERRVTLVTVALASGRSGDGAGEEGS
jgi:putative hemolysin